MTERTKWTMRLDPKRAAALALGPAFLTLGIDAAVEHLAGRADLVVPAQYVPVLFAPLGCVALLAAAASERAARALRAAMKGVGLTAALVGAAGTFFHVRALMRLLEGAELTVAALESALAVAPPLFAPGAFVGLGAVVYLLASPRVTVRVEGGTARAMAPAAA